MDDYKSPALLQQEWVSLLLPGTDSGSRAHLEKGYEPTGGATIVI